MLQCSCYRYYYKLVYPISVIALTNGASPALLEEEEEGAAPGGEETGATTEQQQTHPY